MKTTPHLFDLQELFVGKPQGRGRYIFQKLNRKLMGPRPPERLLKAQLVLDRLRKHFFVPIQPATTLMQFITHQMELRFRRAVAVEAHHCLMGI